MTRICWWLVDRLSRMLEPDDRDAVCGDLAESNASGGQALRDLLGLVIRRQAALWKDWQPWLALLGVVGLVGVRLNQISLSLSSDFHIQLRTYWKYGVRYEHGLTAFEETMVFLCGALALIVWSWTSGFVLGSLSRRAIWVTGTLYFLVWLYPLPLALYFFTRAAGNYRSDLPLLFLTLILHMILRTILFLLPSLSGVRYGLRKITLTLPQASALAAVVVILTALTTWTGVWEYAALSRWSGGIWNPRVGWQGRLFSFAIVSWPAGYLIAIASWRRWPGKIATGLVVAVLIVSATPAFAQSSPQDYPQWRGQNRDGSASAFSEPKFWPDKLTRKWKVEVGEGYATPIVIGSRVYTFTRRDGAEIMTAVDAATGDIVWRTPYPAAYNMAPPTKVHGQGPKSTPLFHNGKLYTLGIGGVVSAFDATSGKLVWQKPAPAEQPFFGAAASPIGDKALVIVHPGNYGPLTAFDANTGAIKWTAKGNGIYASPIIVDLGGVRQVVSMGQQNIIGVAVADGALLWQHPWSGQGGGMQAITPILYGETIIVSSYHMGVTALKPVRRDGKWLVNVIWETKEVSLFLSNPVLIRDTLFGLSERASGQFFALNAETGKVLWLGPPRAATNAAVVKAGDLLFLLLSDYAELIVAKGSQTGFEPLKRYTVADSATWAQPAISGNRVFVKDVSSLALWTLN
jgi:outer membrane protein assembly factor BamB